MKIKNDFRDKLVVDNKIKDSSGLKSIRLFKHLKIGPYYLSIQASYGHYCTPKLTLEDVYMYETMELAILQLYDTELDFVIPSSDAIITKFNRYSELCTYYKDTKVLGSCVPIDLIQDLYLYLYELAESN